MQNESKQELVSLTPIMEDYIEAILVIDEEKRNIRLQDVAKRLGVKMPTVTSMLKVLSHRGLIAYEKYEYLELTAKGVDVGRDVRRRHRILRDFLTDFQKADEEACRMEPTSVLPHWINYWILLSLFRFARGPGQAFLNTLKNTGSKGMIAIRA